jgi:hypothetical protein
MPLAERRERASVAVLGATDEDRVAEPLVDEWRIRAELTIDWTGWAEGRLHDRSTLAPP